MEGRRRRRDGGAAAEETLVRGSNFSDGRVRAAYEPFFSLNVDYGLICIKFKVFFAKVQMTDDEK